MTWSGTESRASDTVLWEGTWQCTKCNVRFPHRRGVAFPAVLNLEWTTTLGEALARRRIFARELEGAAFEGERAERHEEQSTSVARVMDELFQAAIQAAALPPGQAILDVGAGLCDTSSALADQGHAVTAVETEANNLLHIRFAATDSGEPEWIDLPSRRVHVQETQLRPNLIDRVVAPIHRLPFESGSFDVVFCRSVLHHLDDLPRCVREMMRVLKPGGLFIGCSEPARGIFDREDEQLIGGIDKEDGLNEQLPSWFDYSRAIRPWTDRYRIQAWLQDPSPRLARVERWDPLRLRRRIWPGQAVEGWRLLKLLPFSASVNILARRSPVPAPYPPPTSNALPDFSIHDLAEVSCPTSLHNSIRDFDANTQRLAQGWRRMRAMQGGLSSSFIPALASERSLQIGWRRPLSAPSTPAWRNTNKTALVTLLHRTQPPPSELQLVLRSPGSAAASGRVRINGIEVGRLNLPPADCSWYTVRLPIPDGVGTSTLDNQHAVYDIELLGDFVQSAHFEPHGGEAAFAVQFIALLPDRVAPAYS